MLPLEDQSAILCEVVEYEAARDQHSTDGQHRLTEFALHDVREEHAHAAQRSSSVVLGVLLPAQLDSQLLAEHTTSRPHHQLIVSYELLGLALDVPVLIIEELPDLASRKLSLLLLEQRHQPL
ncbi:unnamed protein product [Sphagnum balticum]